MLQFMSGGHMVTCTSRRPNCQLVRKHWIVHVGKLHGHWRTTGWAKDQFSHNTIYFFHCAVYHREHLYHKVEICLRPRSKKCQMCHIVVNRLEENNSVAAILHAWKTHSVTCLQPITSSISTYGEIWKRVIFKYQSSSMFWMSWMCKTVL